MQVDDLYYQDTFSMAVSESKSNEIQRFELLRNELMELEERVQKSADQSQNEEVSYCFYHYKKQLIFLVDCGVDVLLFFVKRKIMYILLCPLRSRVSA